ncbi:MAG: hypothetical protein EB049_05715 [Actinobacteria bacterium]|nr:hypothetical protein [Actinomycetota bacterium]
MAKLLIVTQILENYGSEANPFWKAKGSSEYVIKNFTAFTAVNAKVQSLRSEIEIDNPLYSEYIVSWEVVDNDYLTDFERSQLEYEGRIDFPAIELQLAA